MEPGRRKPGCGTVSPPSRSHDEAALARQK